MPAYKPAFLHTGFAARALRRFGGGFYIIPKISYSEHENGFRLTVSAKYRLHSRRNQPDQAGLSKGGGRQAAPDLRWLKAQCMIDLLTICQQYN
jgi:hypothetical protein